MTETETSKPNDSMGFIERERVLIGKEVDLHVGKVRDLTPAPIVNHGSQISFSLFTLADVMSVWSGWRFTAPWRLAASCFTLFTSALGVVYDEKPESEAYHKKLAEQSWLNFAWEKTKNAFNPKDHILATAGLSTIVNGTLMAISGIKQSTKNKKSWEVIQGGMTAAAGLVMTYMPDRERAWQISRSIFMVRSVPAALQAHNALHHGIPEKNVPKGDWQQWAKWVLNQSGNVFGFLFGGVEKSADGTIKKITKKPEKADLEPQKAKTESQTPTLIQAETITHAFLQAPKMHEQKFGNA